MNRSRRIVLSRAVNIENLRGLARKRVPRVVFDFIDGAAEDELTLAANRAAFEAFTFRPRHAIAMPTCDLRTSLLGSDISLPVLLAPVGSARVIHPEGEVGIARAAGAAGTIYILPTTAGYPLEDVMAASSGPLWYQLYLIGGREAAEAALGRASRAGFSALVVTIDTPVAGMRERDFRNGLKELAGRNLLTKIPFLPQVLVRPRWLMNLLLDGGVPVLPNVIVPGQEPQPLLDVGAALAQAAVTWDCGQGCSHQRRCPASGGSRGGGGGGLESWWTATRRRSCVFGRPSRSRKRGWKQSRSAHGRRHPSRFRRCQSNLPWSPCGPYWTRLRVWSCRRGGRRCCTSARNIARRPGANAAASRLPVSCGAGPLLSQYPTGIDDSGLPSSFLLVNSDLDG